MIAFSAEFLDGVTSRAVLVQVTLDDTQILHVTGDHLIRDVPLAEITIGPRLGNTVRKLLLPDGCALESRDNEALDALLRLSGTSKGIRLVHRLESTWLAASVAAVVLVAGLFLAVKFGIPVAASRLAAAIPDNVAYDLGRGSLAVLDHTMLRPSQLSTERQQELSKGFRDLSESYPNLPLVLNFRRGVGPNALALPDGSVVVTDELVQLAKDDQEIYSVLMHEIGHVHHRHALRMTLEASTAVLLVATYFGDVTQLSTLSNALPGVIAQARYSRELETEADTFALAYLDSHHISRRHYANILRALQKAVGQDPGGGMRYLASHPPTSERIRRFE